MERKEFRLSDEAPPNIHNNKELNEFMEPGLGPLSACPGTCTGLATLSPAPFCGIGGSNPGLNPAPGGKSVLVVNPWFLVFNLVMCNVDARIVDEVMWKSGCC
ncbi:hypothetical protein Lal_00038854 [Lupinus albus]|nr:hypothetical protein Lal_00038854 [Lupinus albus]